MQDGNVQDEPESKELLKKKPHIIGVEKRDLGANGKCSQWPKLEQLKKKKQQNINL